MDLGLKGKNVLITGSSKGLGAGMARCFAKEGANVIISGRGQEAIDALVAEIKADYDVKVVPIKADLGERGQAEMLFEESIKALGSLDILVNNAAIWGKSNFIQDMPQDQFEHHLYLNLEVPFLLCQMMVKHLLADNRKGSILNIVSQAAFHGSTTGHVDYASSKAGLVTFTRSLAREVAKYGITVNAMAPGMMDTPMAHDAIAAKPDYYNGRIPMGYVADGDECAPPCVFLCSEKASYITGVTLAVAGGMLMH